jgi:hypothetical protein
LEGLIDRHGGGAPPRLTVEQQQILKDMSWPRFLWTRDCSTEPRKDDRDERHFV